MFSIGCIGDCAESKDSRRVARAGNSRVLGPRYKCQVMTFEAASQIAADLTVSPITADSSIALPKRTPLA